MSDGSDSAGSATGYLEFIVKSAIAIAAVAALFYFGKIRFDVLLPLTGHVRLLAITAILVFSTLALAALRWQTLLAVQGVFLSYKQIYHICAIGLFSGLYLPGIIGGDALRFFYLSAAVPRHRTIIAMTLLADRLLGLAGLVFVAMAAIVLQWPVVTESPMMKSIAVVIISGCSLAAILGGLAAIVADRLPIDDWKLHTRGVMLRLLGAMINIIALFRRAPRAVSFAFLLSFIIQLCTAAAIALLADAMKLSPSIGPMQYAVAGSTALLAGAIPITPGGLGIGEGAFQALCRFISADTQAPFASAFFAFRCLTVIVLLSAIPSLILYKPRRSG